MDERDRNTDGASLVAQVGFCRLALEVDQDPARRV